LIKQLIEGQEEMTGIRDDIREISKLRPNVRTGWKAINSESVRKPSYGEAVASHLAEASDASKQAHADRGRSLPTKKISPLVQDQRVSIGTGQCVGEQIKYTNVKQDLRAGPKVNKVTENLMIHCPRRGPGDGRSDRSVDARAEPARRA